MKLRIKKLTNNPEGCVEPNTGNGYDYVYQYKDHLGNIRLSYKNTGTGSSPNLEILEENNYYPFGMRHKGYNGNQIGVDHPYGFNGKEEQDELGLEWHDFGWRNYDTALGRWMNIDNHAEIYYSLSTYSSFANNPISFVDPDGQDLLFWQKDSDGKWQQVEFNQLSKEVQESLMAFAKTDEGYNFLSKFANEGDTMGDIEFCETGEFAAHDLSYKEFDYYGNPNSSKAERDEKENNINIDVKINTAYAGDQLYDGINPVAANAITIGHESFIHIVQYLDELIEAFDKGDTAKVNEILSKRKKIGLDGGGRVEHNEYLQNKPEYSQMKTFLTQLKQVLNPKEVNNAIKRHDDNLKGR